MGAVPSVPSGISTCSTSSCFHLPCFAARPGNSDPSASTAHPPSCPPQPPFPSVLSAPLTLPSSQALTPCSLRFREGSQTELNAGRGPVFPQTPLSAFLLSLVPVVGQVVREEGGLGMLPGFGPCPLLLAPNHPAASVRWGLQNPWLPLQHAHGV